jgi:hypothetical protein
MLIGEQYRHAGQDIIEVSATRWIFRKSFAEACLTYLLEHKKLSDAEKSALIKIPVLFLMTVFPYSKEKFYDVFGPALELLDKNLALPKNMENAIEKYKKNIDNQKAILGLKSKDKIIMGDDDITAFVYRPVIDISFTQTIRNSIIKY